MNEEDNQVEIDLSNRSGGESKVQQQDDYNSGNPYNSGVEMQQTKQKQKAFCDDGSQEQQPYGQDYGRTSDSKVLNADQEIKLEHINVQQLGAAQNMNVRSDEMNFDSGEQAFKGVAFERSCCFGRTCTIIRRIFNVVGCLLAIPNVALDLAYIAKSSFYNKAFFATLIVIFMMRLLLILCGFQCYLCYQLGYKPELSTVNIQQESVDDDDDGQNEDGTRSRRYQQVKKQGMTLYLSLNSLMLLGTFRMLPSLFFAKEVAMGYAIELIFNLFPTFLVQMFNNTDQPGMLTGVQSTSLAIKMFLILNFFIEVIICIWEMTLNRKMRKLKIAGFEKVTEEEKRRRFSRKFGLLGLVSTCFFLLILIIILAASSGRECDLRHAMESGVCVPCIDPLCEDCKRDSQTCTTCPKDLNGTAYYLSTRGQCLACDFGCQDCVYDSNDGTKCLKCNQNYFLSQGKYCKHCLNPGCQQCADRDVEVGTQKCLQCEENYWLSKSEELCRPCMDNCMRCSDAGNVISSLTGKQMCLECNVGFFAIQDGQKCHACHTGCDKCEADGDDNADSVDSKCITCSEGFRLDGDKCQDCSDEMGTSNCGACDDKNVCIECMGGFYLDKSSGKPECKKCSDKLINCVECAVENGEPKCLRCDTQIADLNENGQCLKCKPGWTLDIDLKGKDQCICGHILNTKQGYSCQKCEEAIQGCATCQYTMDPGTKLKAHVGEWNKTHSAQKGMHSKRETDTQLSEHVICLEPGPGLVVVPDSDGKDMMRKCGDAFPGCTSCANSGIYKTPTCQECHKGYFRYRSGSNNRCGKCSRIPNRPGMEHCDSCNEFVCDNCIDGYHQLMGGCFKCYFDWQCNAFQ